MLLFTLVKILIVKADGKRLTFAAMSLLEISFLAFRWARSVSRHETQNSSLQKLCTSLAIKNAVGLIAVPVISHYVGEILLDDGTTSGYMLGH